MKKLLCYNLLFISLGAAMFPYMSVFGMETKPRVEVLATTDEDSDRADQVLVEQDAPADDVKDDIQNDNNLEFPLEESEEALDPELSKIIPYDANLSWLSSFKQKAWWLAAVGKTGADIATDVISVGPGTQSMILDAWRGAYNKVTSIPHAIGEGIAGGVIGKVNKEVEQKFADSGRSPEEIEEAKRKILEEVVDGARQGGINGVIKTITKPLGEGIVEGALDKAGLGDVVENEEAPGPIEKFTGKVVKKLAKASNKTEEEVAQAGQNVIGDVIDGAKNDGIDGISKKVTDSAGGNLVKKVLEGIGIDTAPKLGLFIGGVAALIYAIKLAYTSLDNYLIRPKLEFTIVPPPPGNTGGSYARNMVYGPQTAKQLRTVEHNTGSIHRAVMRGENKTYDNALFYGPPGNGKCMFAQQLAIYADMVFYYIPWSSFNKFTNGGDATIAIDNFFKNEATKSEKGAIIFIDDAQILFSEAAINADSSTMLGSVINAIISNTKNPSSKYMVIFGMPEKPVMNNYNRLIVNNNRIVHVDEPGFDQRLRLLKLYRDTYFKLKQLEPEELEEVEEVLNDQVLEQLAQKLDKASAAEIADFMKTLEIESKIPTSQGLTAELVQETLENAASVYTDFIIES